MATTFLFEGEHFTDFRAIEPGEFFLYKGEYFLKISETIAFHFDSNDLRTFDFAAQVTGLDVTIEVKHA